MADVLSEPTDVVTVLEKNGQRRTVALDARLQAALTRVILVLPQSSSPYVFPHPRDPQRPRTAGQNQRWLQGLCRRAGVAGIAYFKFWHTPLRGGVTGFLRKLP